MYNCFPCVLSILDVLLPPSELAPLSGHGGIIPFHSSVLGPARLERADSTVFVPKPVIDIPSSQKPQG